MLARGDLMTHVDNFNADWKTKHESPLPSIYKLACNYIIKFILPKYHKYIFQDPSEKLNKSIFIVTKPVSVETLQNATSACEVAESDEVMRELAGQFFDTLIQLRQANNIIVGNYVVFDGVDDDQKGLILGVSHCTEDFIRHAHLCKLIPEERFYKCSGGFMLNVATKRFICLPYSGSWMIMKNWFKNESFYGRLDEINQYIASNLFEKLVSGVHPFSTIAAMNEQKDFDAIKKDMVAYLSQIHTEHTEKDMEAYLSQIHTEHTKKNNAGSDPHAGGAFITVLGRRRKVYMIGKTKMVNVCKVPIRLSKAYQMEKKQQK